MYFTFFFEKYNKIVIDLISLKLIYEYIYVFYFFF